MVFLYNTQHRAAAVKFLLKAAYACEFHIAVWHKIKPAERAKLTIPVQLITSIFIVGLPKNRPIPVNMMKASYYHATKICNFCINFIEINFKQRLVIIPMIIDFSDNNNDNITTPLTCKHVLYNIKI